MAGQRANQATFTRGSSRGILIAYVEAWRSPRLMLRLAGAEEVKPGEILRCTMVDGGHQLRQVFSVIDVSGGIVQCWLTDSHISTSHEREPRLSVNGVLVDVSCGLDRFSGKLTNASRSGIAFAAFDRMPVGARISLRLADSQLTLAMNAKVVRAKQAPNAELIEYGAILEGNGRVVLDLWMNFLQDLAIENPAA